MKSEVLKKKEQSTMDNSIAGPSKHKTITTNYISNTNEPQVETMTNDDDNENEVFEVKQQPIGLNAHKQYTYSATSFGKMPNRAS